MSQLRTRRPSPALVISILALFVALGGSAYAATKVGTKDIKANAITSAKIKKNAVTTAKIKKNAVTTAKIKKDAVTGAKVKESTLGTVPSATNSVNATNATNFSRYFSSGLVKASSGTNVSLGTVGPFSFVGKCTDGGGGKAESLIVMTTSATDSFMYSKHDQFNEAGFSPGVEAKLTFQLSTNNPAWFGGGAESSFNAASPDGATVIDGIANNGAGVFGAQCAFQVSWTSEA